MQNQMIVSLKRNLIDDGRFRLTALATASLLLSALAPLTRQEMEAFTELAGKLLVGLMREPGATRWMCRLCGLSACGRPDGNCPLEREARVRYG